MRISYLSFLYQLLTCPPSTLNIDPVMYFVSSEAKYITKFDMSLGLPNDLRAIFSFKNFSVLTGEFFIFFDQVEPLKIILPGAIAFILV